MSNAGALVNAGEGRHKTDLCHSGPVRRARPHRVSINKTTASGGHTLPKPINAMRLSQARVGSRASCVVLRGPTGQTADTGGARPKQTAAAAITAALGHPRVPGWGTPGLVSRY